MTNDSLGDRMKGYEQAARVRLPMRMPVILRIDGRAFHTYTRDCDKPFDAKLMSAMDDVALRLCEEVQGAQIAYVQSDEISILVHNYKRLQSQAWFDNQVQKMVSVAASVAAAMMTALSYDVFGGYKLASFDARAFVLPEAEVCNYFVWRQQDATRNSIQMLARSLYSHAECVNKNQAALQEMCFAKGYNWNDLPVAMRRGRCVVPIDFNIRTGGHRQDGWSLDLEPPIFTQDRHYIEKHLECESEEDAA